MALCYNDRMGTGDKVYIRHAYIERNGLRQAHGAQRIVGEDVLNVELEAWYALDLARTVLRLDRGGWTEPFDMRPGRMIVPHSAIFPPASSGRRPARTAILC